jgi:hypothetical protein
VQTFEDIGVHCDDDFVVFVSAPWDCWFSSPESSLLELPQPTAKTHASVAAETVRKMFIDLS